MIFRSGGVAFCAALVSLLSCCNGCSERDAHPKGLGPESPIRVRDGRGSSVVLAKEATRVVSLAPSTTEIIYAIGAGSRLKRRDDHADFPPEVLGIESVGGTHPAVNAESVVAASPDLILAAGSNNLSDLERLEALGLAVYATTTTRGFEDLYVDIRGIGTLCGARTAADSLVALLQARVVQVVESRPLGVDPPTVFFELDSGDPGRPWTCGKGSFIDELLRVAGAANIAGAETDSYLQLSLERLVALDPEFIVRCTRGAARHTTLLNLPGWSSLSAVREGRVYEVDENLLVRPGPRLIDGLEAVAHCVDLVVQRRRP